MCPLCASQLFVDDISDVSDLEVVVSHGLASVPDAPVRAVVDFYTRARTLADETLLDGAGQKPRYSLRTLCRVLRFSTHMIPLGTLHVGHLARCLPVSRAAAVRCAWCPLPVAYN